jgi:hypothetical protein
MVPSNGSDGNIMGRPGPGTLSSLDQFIRMVNNLPLNVQEDLIYLAKSALGIGKSLSPREKKNTIGVDGHMVPPSVSLLNGSDASPLSPPPPLPLMLPPPFSAENDTWNSSFLGTKGLDSEISSNDVENHNSSGIGLKTLLAIILPTTLGTLSLAMGLLLYLRRMRSHLPSNVPLPDAEENKGSPQGNLGASWFSDTEVGLAGKDQLQFLRRHSSMEQLVISKLSMNHHENSRGMLDSLGFDPDSSQAASFAASKGTSLYQPPRSLIRAFSGPNSDYSAGVKTWSGSRTFHLSATHQQPSRRNSADPSVDLAKINKGSGFEDASQSQRANALEMGSLCDSAGILSSRVQNYQDSIQLEDIDPSRDIVLGDKLGSGAFGTVGRPG